MRVWVAAMCAVSVVWGVTAQEPFYRMENNFVIVEAEELAYSSEYWSLQTAPDGYGGSGWLLNTRDEAGSGSTCHTEAMSTNCLNPEAGWLKVPVYIESVQGDHGGVFSVDLRCWRGQGGDGANDVWVGIEDYESIQPGGAIAYRIGRSHEGYGYMWGSLSPETEYEIAKFPIDESHFGKVITFFVSPRSSSNTTNIHGDCIGVDRILVYYCPFKTSSRSFDDSNIDFPTAAWQTATPATQPSSSTPVRIVPPGGTVAGTTGRRAAVHLLSGRLLVGQPRVQRSHRVIRLTGNSEPWAAQATTESLQR